MFSFENTKNCGAAMLSCQSVSPVVLLQSDKSRHFLNFIQTKMWMFCTSGRRRRTKRWRSSSGWSWCLWNRSSKSHRVRERLKITHAHHLKETRALYVIMSLFSLSLYDKILQSPRDKSLSRLPTSHPSPSQERPSLRTAAEPPSVL